ncbi:ABC transporter substrate-binding protein [Halomonas urumqiensis]|uniref:Spermidine/putrescine ABC transporter substrate-binding protein n=1 Tax=Halomonas urumqiensis TaxID=1684789 RepID=A0A2N7UQV2_9GAMM|nr:ABC transporter substrate-binding protein [Halomonas urumqiensis]PMR82802.1 spermidine/putrescine ABC transporter substrate-binding protein [Halomonas urumqiensis]PTB01879.1 ABC transporter substrate-binding protein [Halomonas urumqiensis]GHE21983.1 ABC polyamine/opine transporter substrate-binding protein [Halomonas urumqiensis]
MAAVDPRHARGNPDLPRAGSLATSPGLPGSLVWLLVALLLVSPVGQASDKATLRVLSWGGAYERAQQQALFAPFSAATGRPVEVMQYAGGIDELRRAEAEGEVPWDIIDMTKSDAMAACHEGLLQPLAPSLLAPSPEGTPPIQDFLPGSLSRCAITHSLFATVVAYRTDAFPGRRPTSIDDLFDAQRFPGPRALKRSAAANMEWALLAYDVPHQELYRLLSTRRGLRLALDRLGELPDIRWWQDGQTPVELLTSGAVVMASGYNGRFFDAMVNAEAPIEILWDGQVQEHETWVIPRGAPNPDAARKFLRFATSTERQAELARHIPYGPARRSASLRVTEHPESGADMRLHIPTHPLNAQRVVIKDEAWYAGTHERIQAFFEAWLADREAD